VGVESLLGARTRDQLLYQYYFVITKKQKKNQSMLLKFNFGMMII